MAAHHATILTTGDITCSAGVAETVLQLLAASNIAVNVWGFGVAFDSISATDEPCTVNLVRQSDVGSLSAGTIVSNDPGRDETLQTTAFVGPQTDPTDSADVRTYLVHPQSGIEREFTERTKIIVPGGARLGLQVIAPAEQDCRAFILIEE